MILYLLHYMILYHIILYIILYCIILYCIVFVFLLYSPHQVIFYFSFPLHWIPTTVILSCTRINPLKYVTLYSSLVTGWVYSVLLFNYIVKSLFWNISCVPYWAHISQFYNPGAELCAFTFLKFFFCITVYLFYVSLF